jgi:hypothetical protein
MGEGRTTKGRETTTNLGDTREDTIVKEETADTGPVGCLTVDTANGGMVVGSNTRLAAMVATRDKEISDHTTGDLHRGTEKDVVLIAHIGIVVDTVTQKETELIPHGMKGIGLTPDTMTALRTGRPTDRENTTGIDVPTNAKTFNDQSMKLYNRPSSSQPSWDPLADPTQVSDPKTTSRRQAPQLTERKQYTQKEWIRYLEPVTVKDAEVLGDRPRT